MKVKNLVLMALVATMGLVSCSKDEHEDGVKTDTMPKSVTIKLPNIQKTVKSRATGDAMKGGSQVALKISRCSLWMLPATCKPFLSMRIRINRSISVKQILSGLK